MKSRQVISECCLSSARQVSSRRPHSNRRMKACIEESKQAQHKTCQASRSLAPLLHWSCASFQLILSLTMSNPYQQQRQPPFSASGWNGNTGHQSSNGLPYEQQQQGPNRFSTNAFPQHETFNLKRSRDNASPTDHTMRQSFKRLKVMEDDSTGPATNMAQPLQAVSVDESSLADESATPPGGGHFAQHSAFFPQPQGDPVHHSFHQQGRKRQRLQDDNYSHTYAPKSQPPGQGSGDVTTVDYQPMNSLLGSLHRARRRQHHGTGQEAVAVGNHQGMSMQQNQQSTRHYDQPLQNQQQQQGPHYQAKANRMYTRPVKKKNVSYTSNLG